MVNDLFEKGLVIIDLPLFYYLKSCKKALVLDYAFFTRNFFNSKRLEMTTDKLKSTLQQISEIQAKSKAAVNVQMSVGMLKLSSTFEVATTTSMGSSLSTYDMALHNQFF